MLRVLVIEDEDVLRDVTVRGLQKLPGVEVSGAATLGEALVLLDAERPGLILSDLDLPDRTGIELIGELAGRDLQIPIVFISAYLKAYGSQIPPNAGVRVLEKPVALDDLRALVLEHVGVSSRPEETSPFGVVDYIQLAGMGGHSVKIDVNGSDDDWGTIIVNRGEVWHAEDSLGEGRDALIRLIETKTLRVGCHTMREDPGPRSISGRWEEVLLEAVRTLDESNRDKGGGEALAAPAADTDSTEDLEFDLDLAFDPDASAAPEIQPEDRFSEAMEQGLEALLAKDYEQALAAFIAAREMRPEDRVVEANLPRLRELGVGEATADDGDQEGGAE